MAVRNSFWLSKSFGATKHEIGNLPLWNKSLTSSNRCSNFINATSSFVSPNSPIVPTTHGHCGHFHSISGRNTSYMLRTSNIHGARFHPLYSKTITASFSVTLTPNVSKPSVAMGRIWKEYGARFPNLSFSGAKHSLRKYLLLSNFGNDCWTCQNAQACRNVVGEMNTWVNGWTIGQRSAEIKASVESDW